LLPEHSCQLMQMSVEGPVLPDVRDASDTDRSDFDSLVDSAYELWLTQPRHGV